MESTQRTASRSPAGQAAVSGSSRRVAVRLRGQALRLHPATAATQGGHLHRCVGPVVDPGQARRAHQDGPPGRAQVGGGSSCPNADDGAAPAETRKRSWIFAAAARTRGLDPSSPSAQEVLDATRFRLPSRQELTPTPSSVASITEVQGVSHRHGVPAASALSRNDPFSARESDPPISALHSLARGQESYLPKRKAFIAFSCVFQSMIAS